MKNNLKIKKGFTLVEMLIAVGLFTLIASISLGAILNIFDANRRNQSSKTVVDNLNFSIENMARTVRFGTNYHCGSTGDLATARNCSTGDNILAVNFESKTVVYVLRYDLIYEYDIKTDKIRKLALPFENYDLEGDVIRKSPDGTKVASCGRRGIRVFDLIDNKEIVSIPARNVDGLLGGVDEFTVPPEKDPETLFQWTSNTTLVYPIYAQEGESVPPYHFKESKIIRLP
jgi:prepilin-type N-terminal cleavage/methylation domain-containing protein